MSSTPRSLLRVVIAGGGVGALEAAFALRDLACDRVTVTVIAPERHFTYRPLTIGEPFGLDAWRIELDEIASDRGFALVRDAVDHVDPDLKLLVTQDGKEIEYDVLVLALGARSRPAVAGALTFRGPADGRRVGVELRKLHPGRRHRVVFAAPSVTTWTLPIYELALMTGEWAEHEGIDVDVAVVTAEATPLQAFGPAASDDIARLLDQSGIALYPASFAEAVGDGQLWIALEGGIPADLVVALPRLVGPAVRGIPHDGLGFAPVDEYGRVRGVDDVYAIGDMADWPVKQGGLATQQADAAATAIAAGAGAEVIPHPYDPVLRAMLLTGRDRVFLRWPPGPPDPHPEPGLADAPWWPPHKIAGRYLAPYLAVNAHLLVPGEPNGAGV